MFLIIKMYLENLQDWLLIPKSLQEQKAIAKILSTADKEIDLLTQELEQLKLQKKGLMQLLINRYS
jgi:type I restriction enzyme S subunit